MHCFGNSTTYFMIKIRHFTSIAYVVMVILLMLLLNGSTEARQQYMPGFDVLHYEFSLHLYDKKEAIDGTAVVTGLFRSRLQDTIQLDFITKKGQSGGGIYISDLSINDRQKIFIADGNYLRIPTPASTQIGDTVKISVTYQGIPLDGLIIGKNKYGSRTFFGDNWPNRARHWLPTVDHPSDKATCEFKILAPSHFDVIANGKLIGVTKINSREQVTHWYESVPIPTKVMVIGVANFQVEYHTAVESIPVESWVYPENAEEGFYDFAITPGILGYYVYKLGKYPFEKFAHVQSSTRYGSMENASNIFYSENAVTGKRKIEELIAHETVHQWFGNSLTEKDWNDIWLSEGFATYLTALYLEEKYGQARFHQSMLEQKEELRDYMRQHPTSTIVPGQIRDINNLLNANSYEKASWILHMLRKEIGTELFWKVIRSFHQKYALSNASSEDFVNHVNSVTSSDKSSFFRQWLYEPGIPKFTYSWNFNSNKHEIRVDLLQHQEFTYDVPIEFLVQFKKYESQPVKIRCNQKRQSFIIEIGQDKMPKQLLFDPDHWLLAEFVRQK